VSAPDPTGARTPDRAAVVERVPDDADAHASGKVQKFRLRKAFE
jgi:hypothetical protein